MRYYSYSILILFGELFFFYGVLSCLCQSSFYSLNAQNSPTFFFFFFLSFGFIIIELNRTWERKIVTERDIERDSLAKRGGRRKRKASEEKMKKPLGLATTRGCVYREREKKKASLMSSKVRGSRKCTSEARRGE